MCQEWRKEERVSTPRDIIYRRRHSSPAGAYSLQVSLRRDE
jgi:hypothetical protein